MRLVALVANSVGAWFLSTAIRSIAAEDDDPTEDTLVDLPECGLYLAVSSTSTAEEPKWGLYAGTTIDKSQPIGYGELAIQTFHLLANQLTIEDEQEKADNNALADIVDFVEQYIWVPHSSGGQFELDDDGRIVTAIPGVGVLGGFNAKLTNADWNHSQAFHRPNWGEQVGKAHPGRGASSQYFEVTLSALATIPAGSEIFVNYGENWDPEGEEDDEDSAVLTKEDYDRVDQTVEKMIEFFDKHKDELDETSKNEIYQFLVNDVLSAAAGKRKAQKIASMMPESPDGLPDIKVKGGSLKLLGSNSIRSLPWLANHGRCMDNIKPGPSTIPNAGRGAIATRSMASGSIIAPVPLIQIVQDDIMTMYPLQQREDEEGETYFIREEGAEPSGSQILLNYCLGHAESRMLFFPAGSATSFINHSPTPNAKLVWSDHPNHHQHWFELEPAALMEEGNEHLGLLMEVVALKDIAEGEEITIDYGPEWAAAWEEHVRTWEERVQTWEAATKDGSLSADWPIRAIDYNTQHVDKPIPLDANEYPENLALKCFLLVKKPPADESAVNEAGQKVRYWVESHKTMTSENVFDCTLMDVVEVVTPEGAMSWNYTVSWQGKMDTTIVKKVPHKALVFTDKPGTSDQHVKQAFRHWIGIPDDIFPKGPWRDRGRDVDAEDEEDDEYVDEDS